MEEKEMFRNDVSALLPEDLRAANFAAEEDESAGEVYLLHEGKTVRIFPIGANGVDQREIEQEARRHLVAHGR